VRAAAPARAAISADGSFSLVLPGTWATIPLSDDADAEKRITALVKQQVGKNDRLASRRRQLRQELVKAAHDAAAQDAISFSIALEIMTGVPFPGSIMSRLEAWPASAVGSTPQERLAAGFPAATLIQTESGPAARVATSEPTKYVEETTPSLSLDYWIPVPSGARLLVTTVALPMVSDEALFTELFDTVMGSIQWAVSADSDSASDGSVSSDR